MADLHEEIEIREDQAEAIARGLYAVAKADGVVHPAEAAMINDFYASTSTSEHPSNMAALEKMDAIDGAHLAAVLPTKSLRLLFLKTAVLLSYADGTYGVEESRLIAQFSKDMGITDSEMRVVETQVKEYMLAQLSHIRNYEAMTEVAKTLKV